MKARHRPSWAWVLLLVVGVVLGTAHCASPPPKQEAGTGEQAEMTPTQAGAAAVYSVTRSSRILRVPDQEAHYTRSGVTVPALARANVLPKHYADKCHVTPKDIRVRGAKTVCDDYGNPRGRVKVSMIGDSKMGQWFTPMRTIATREGWRMSVRPKSSCPLSTIGVSADCAKYNKALVRHLIQVEKPDVVFVSSVHSSTKISTGLTSITRMLTDRGIEVVFFKDTPVPASGPSVLTCLRATKDYLSCRYPLNEGSGARSIRKAHSAVPGTQLISLDRYVCPTHKACPAVVNRTPVFRQGSHISDAYATSMTDVIHARLYQEKIARVRPPASAAAGR